MSANSTSGSPGTTSTSRRSRSYAGKPPVPTLALWSRRDGIVAPSAARGPRPEVDKAVEIDTHHMGFAVDRPALSQVVDEIRMFLAEAEGSRRRSQPMRDCRLPREGSAASPERPVDSQH